MITELNSQIAISHDAITSPSSVPTHGRYVGFSRALKTVGRWIERSRQRRKLADLEDWQLKDLGLSRAQVNREIAKAFWR